MKNNNKKKRWRRFAKKKHSRLFHITDWLPTLHSAAGGGGGGGGGGRVATRGGGEGGGGGLPADLDGVDQWPLLSAGKDGESARREMLYNINPRKGSFRPVNAAIRCVMGGWVVGLEVAGEVVGCGCRDWWWGGGDEVGGGVGGGVINPTRHFNCHIKQHDAKRDTT